VWRQASADSLYLQYTGRPFNSLEPAALCHLAFVRSLSFDDSQGAGGGGGGGVGVDMLVDMEKTGEKDIPQCVVSKRGTARVTV
jgi:hypothetical protein